MRKLLTTVAVAALVGTACAVPDPVGAPVPEGVPNCVDVPRIEAPLERYREEPQYVGNEMPVDEVRSWASTQPAFEDIWIDRDHNGWVTVAFSKDADARQAEIEEMFPSDGVVAVSVDWTSMELSDLQERVHQELPDLVQGSGTYVNRGVVSISIGVLTTENLETVNSRFAGEPMCVEGLDPADAVAPGPQPEAGEGWRLLAAERGVGATYRTGIAFDEDSLIALTAMIGLETVPDVDFDSEVAIWFGAVYGSSCPDLRLDDVVVEDATIYADIVLPSNPVACTDDANPYAFVVAVHRDRLPAPPFRIQLDAGQPPAGAPEERTVVSADLRPAGATATTDEIGPDPDLGGGRPVMSGDIIEPGFPIDYAIDLSCGFEWLGEINSYQWVAATPIPETWIEATDDAAEATVEVLLIEGNRPTVEVTYLNEMVVYTIGGPPTC